MQFDTKTVAKIAKLSRLRVTPQEQEEYAKELSSIFKWIEQLQAVNTDGVEQMTSVADMKLPQRKDEVTDGNIREKVLQNAPESDYGCFVVPKVIE